jgi:GT2 family glycosyltransferase
VAAVQVIIVAHGGAADVAGCLAALAAQAEAPDFAVLVTENAGPAAFVALRDRLLGPEGPCAAAPDPATRDPAAAPEHVIPGAAFRAVAELRLRPGGQPVRLGLAVENLGYAGGINAWLGPLLAGPVGWEAAWILNPDTRPAPGALSALRQAAAARGKGMLGCRIVATPGARVQHARGLRWRRWLASTEAVDRGAAIAPAPDPALVEARLDSPSGAAVYVTRAALRRIGLPEPGYFLYYEDLDWGLHARRAGLLGYAHAAEVAHAGGGSIGRLRGPGAAPLAVHLEYRNRLVFVRRNFPGWWLWTALLGVPHALRYALTGSPRLALVALGGLWAGLRGRQGRPEKLLARHRPPGG